MQSLMITIKEDDPPYLFYVGETFTVEWYYDEQGRMKAKECYLEQLSEDEKDRLRSMVVYIANSPHGTFLPKRLYNLEDAENKIYAFKPKDYRFFNFMTAGKKIIIVDAYRKHSQKMGKKDLNLVRTAIKAREDYLDRIQRGTYYER